MRTVWQVPRVLATLALAGGFAVAGGLAPATGHAQGVRVSPGPPAPTSSGWLGIALAEIVDPGAEPAVLITGVRPGSPSAAAGLVEGDRILRLNGAPVGLERIRSMTRRLEPGDPVAFRILRGGEQVDVTVVAGLRPASGILVPERLREELEAVGGRLVEILHREGEAGANLAVTVDGGTLRVMGLPDPEGLRRRVRVEVEGPVSPLTPFTAGINRVAGAELRELTPELGAYFRTEAGLLVTSVAGGTPAAQAGLRAGDVVVAAAGRPVTDVNELRRRLATPGVEPVLTVVRKGQRLEIRLR